MNITRGGAFMYKGRTVMLAEDYFTAGKYTSYGCRPDWGLLWPKA